MMMTRPLLSCNELANLIHQSMRMTYCPRRTLFRAGEQVNGMEIDFLGP